MRRLLILLTLTGFFMPMTQQPIEAIAGPNGPCSGRDYYVNQRTAPDVRETRMRRLIRCVFTYVGIPGEIDQAMYVSWRESHRIPWAKNPWTDAACRPFGSNPFGSCGTFQHLARYWAGRVRSYLPARFFPHWPEVGVLSARGNIWAAAVMVREGGWGPW